MPLPWRWCCLGARADNELSEPKHEHEHEQPPSACVLPLVKHGAVHGVVHGAAKLPTNIATASIDEATRFAKRAQHCAAANGAPIYASAFHFDVPPPPPR